MATAATRDKIMERVQALLNKANSTQFDEERDALIAKADELMIRFAIEQFELDQHRAPDAREKPVVRVVIAPQATSYDVKFELNTLFYSLARHCGVMMGKDHAMIDGDRGWKVVGYEADIDYLQMLYLNIQMNLVSQMEPKVDPSKSDAENYGALREAGLSIDQIIHKLGQYDAPKMSTIRGRLRKAYRDHCEAKGITPVKGSTGEAYRVSFLYGYRSRLDARLREMSNARDEAGTGHSLAIVGRQDAVQEVLWAAWPEMRPHPEECECADCHTRKCHDPRCKRPRCINKNKPVRYRAQRTVQMNYAGFDRGKSAANTANLSRGSVGGGEKGGRLGS